MSFSGEEKNLIMFFSMENSLDGYSVNDEEKWQELGSQMGRDWTEIRDAYRQWKLRSMDNKHESESLEVNLIGQESNSAGSIPISPCCHQDFPNFEGDLGATMDVRNVDCNPDEYYVFPDDMQLVPSDGRPTDFGYMEQYIYNDTETLNNVNFEDQAVDKTSRKRKRIEELDSDLIETLIHQSEEELELRRREHEEKMKIYNMHLEQGRELHQEKMEILRAKLKAVQEKVYHIEYAINNRNLHKRFKSGPI